ncbi:MAG TPA: alpha/beta fold hydrolase [Candidatus Saccharimonadales bacterium]|nr:alpha/beta fold hydrolase [Candidatus Saccharimonadales bacterium]
MMRNARGIRPAALLLAGIVCLGGAADRAAAQDDTGDRRPLTESEQIYRRIDALEKKLEAASMQMDSLQKSVDDVLWFDRVGDVATIDKVYIPTVPNPKGEEEYGIANARHPFRMWAYVFVPKSLDTSRKTPLLLLPHGGVHSDFTTYYTHIVRELMDSGYVVVAPEYRGSTGYGKSYYEAIDYGGLEVDDVAAARDWALETMPFLDGGRVGILGWSHGGLIALMSVFEYPGKYQVAYAGVPVSDLVARMGYQTEGYRELYSADYHIGKTANEDVDEYRRRSPAWNAAKLKTPLLIHTNTNDRDVNVLEVEHLIQALKAEGKDFEYKIYQDAPGGHSFNRMDSPLARESRKEVYAFLARYLK